MVKGLIHSVGDIYIYIENYRNIYIYICLYTYIHSLEAKSFLQFPLKPNSPLEFLKNNISLGRQKKTSNIYSQHKDLQYTHKNIQTLVKIHHLFFWERLACFPRSYQFSRTPTFSFRHFFRGIRSDILGKFVEIQKSAADLINATKEGQKEAS